MKRTDRTQATHTPGPWAMDRQMEQWLHQETIHIQPADGASRNTALAIVLRPTTDARMVANARLITAAPDLLAVLERWAENDAAHAAGLSQDEYEYEYNRIAQDGVRAIAKARGS